MEELKIDEKIKLVSGKGMWQTQDLDGKFESVFFADGPHGLRKEQEGTKYVDAVKATCFPTASAIACSWDIDAIKMQAEAIAKEAINHEVSIVLGPGVNMKRNPLCGRNFEYFSEDPYLSGTLAASYINAMEGMGVGTSLKHFAANNQETLRQTSNSQIDERALREIYLRPFQLALELSKPATIMTAYNRLNGTYCSENKWLLMDILRNEWGYEGAVISDWSACVRLDRCIEAGMDLEMPDSLGLHSRDLKNALENGEVQLSSIDRAVENIIKLKQNYRLSHRTKRFDITEHHKLATELASRSAVLLKNEGVLPIKDRNKKVVLIGELAQNTRIQGGGSSKINPIKKISILDAFQERHIEFDYQPGYILNSQEINNDLVDKAMKSAQAADIIIFFGGLTDDIEGEGFDRKSYNMPANQEHLIKLLNKLGKDIVYVSFSGAPYRIDFLDGISAFLQMYLAGEGVSEAVVDILTGKVNPSGKLAETWPKNIDDVLSTAYFGLNSKDIEYRESIFIGYRYFDRYNIEPLFDFGEGYSYSKFAYDNLELEDFDLVNKKFNLSFDVTNLGPYTGEEVVQVYVKNPKEYYLRANKELRAFTKVFLKVGEKKRVEIELDKQAFAIYDVPNQTYIDVRGEYEIQIASSVSDVMLSEKVFIDGERYNKVELSAMDDFFVDGKPTISRNTFETLYHGFLSDFDRIWPGEYSLYNSLDEMSEKSFAARLVRKLVRARVRSMFMEDGKETTQTKMMVEGALSGPFDAVISQSNMKIMRNLGNFMVNLCNGRRFKAILSLLFGI